MFCVFAFGYELYVMQLPSIASNCYRATRAFTGWDLFAMLRGVQLIGSVTFILMTYQVVHDPSSIATL